MNNQCFLSLFFFFFFVISIFFFFSNGAKKGEIGPFLEATFELKSKKAQ